MTDFRYALRSLARAPGFCAAAVLTLALGIGLNTAVLSAAYNVLLRPLDLPEPERLYSVTQNMEKRGGRNRRASACSATGAPATVPSSGWRSTRPTRPTFPA